MASQGRRPPGDSILDSHDLLLMLDRLRGVWAERDFFIDTPRKNVKGIYGYEPSSREVTRDKKMSRCHLPEVAFHQVYNAY